MIPSQHRASPLLTTAMLLLIYSLSPAQARAPAIPAEQFDEQHKLIKPQPGEAPWARIPWLTNLAEARQKAVALDKPLFVWRAGGGLVLGRA
jgi:hypothetical protein